VVEASIIPLTPRLSSTFIIIHHSTVRPAIQPLTTTTPSLFPLQNSPYSPPPSPAPSRPANQTYPTAPEVGQLSFIRNLAQPRVDGCCLITIEGRIIVQKQYLAPVSGVPSPIIHPRRFLKPVHDQLDPSGLKSGCCNNVWFIFSQTFHRGPQ